MGFKQGGSYREGDESLDLKEEKQHFNDHFKSGAILEKDSLGIHLPPQGLSPFLSAQPIWMLSLEQNSQSSLDIVSFLKNLPKNLVEQFDLLGSQIQLLTAQNAELGEMLLLQS